MTIEIPDSAVEVENRSKTDVQRILPESNPRLKNGWLNALITSTANRIFDFYLQLKSAIRENFPDTATGGILERWAAIWGKQRLAASKSSGNIVATGTAGGIVLSGTTVSTNGSLYTSTSSATISSNSISISSITRSGQTATVTTVSDHGLASNVPVTISGADQTEYNVTDAAITVTALNKFEYQVTGSPATPATGTILAGFTSASVPIESDDFGIDTNLDAGTQLTLQSPIVNVDDTLTVDFGAIGGGTDQETDTGLSVRTLERIQNPVALFNPAAITDKAKEVPGVTRVFVQPITPGVGQVTVYFMRDDDVNPIPTASEVAKVREKIEEIVPANTDEDNDLFVLAPTGVSVNFIFTALSPDTSTMRSSIEASLGEFFDESTSVGVDVDEDAYRSAIFNTVDTATGDIVSSFTLSAPVGDVTIASGEIGILGTVTFSI